jgi:hypothetical protein
MRESLTYLYNCVDAVFFAVFHVGSEHLDDGVEIKLPCPAELEQERIIVPWIFGDLVFLDPLLKLSETLCLGLGHVIQVPTKVGLQWLTYPSGSRTFSFFLPHI